MELNDPFKKLDMLLKNIGAYENSKLDMDNTYGPFSILIQIGWSGRVSKEPFECPLWYIDVLVLACEACAFFVTWCSVS